VALVGLAVTTNSESEARRTPSNPVYSEQGLPFGRGPTAQVSRVEGPRHPVGEPDTVRYTLAFRTGDEPVFDVTLQFHAPAGRLALYLPTYTPGGFLSNWSRWVRRFQAVDSAGQVIVHHRTSSHEWTLLVSTPITITVRYQVLPDRADPLGMIANRLSSNGAFFQGTTLFMYSPIWRDNPVSVALDMPADWRVASPVSASGTRALHAQHYDELALAPVQVGRFSERTVSITPCGCAVRIVLDDTALPPYDTLRFDRTIRSVVEGGHRIFGSTPFATLLVLLHWRPDLEFGGGLSRREALVLNIGSQWAEDLPASIAGTFTHELLHTWNWGSFKPHRLMRPDFVAPAPEDFLWLVEGWTNYALYELFARSGWLTEERFLALLAADITALERASGRGWLRLTEAGTTDAIDAAERLPAAASGAAAAFVLDLVIRRFSGGRGSLDEVLRALYAESRRDGYAGFDRSDLLLLLSQSAGMNMEAVYGALIESIVPPDYDRLLDGTGVALRRSETPDGPQYRIEVLTVEGSRLIQQIRGS
jgi:predicted metalloprotease with PDZ domain